MIYTRGVGKAAAASTAEVLTWTETDNGINTADNPVFEWYFTMTGTARDYDALNYIVAKAAGAQFWRVNELQHAAFLQRLGKKAGPGATATRFTVPFDLGSWDPSVIVGAPLNKGLRAEIDIDNTPSATGTVTLFHGRMPGVVPTHYPKYLASAAGVAASATSARYPVTQNGILRGICLPRTTSITDIRLYINNQVVWDLSGPGLLEAQEQSEGGTVSLNRFVLTDPFPIVPGATFVELTVDGSWATTDEVSFYSLVPQGEA